jgi:hypothetical protein
MKFIFPAILDSDLNEEIIHSRIIFLPGIVKSVPSEKKYTEGLVVTAMGVFKLYAYSFESIY